MQYSYHSYMIFSSISILCRPVVVRKFFLMVSMVELANHSLNVCKTNFAVTSPEILYWKAIFHAKFFSEICVTEVRFLICISVVVRTCLLVTKYLTHSQIWKISVSPKFSRLNVVSVYFIMASSFHHLLSFLLTVLLLLMLKFIME